MKNFIFISTIMLLSLTMAHAQIPNSKTETVTVSGNCGMCKKTIEAAGTSKKVSSTEWNKETKVATITYNTRKTTLDEVLKNISLAGYDNDKYLAPSETYNKLPGCCQYDRTKKTAAITEKNPEQKPAMEAGHEGHDHGAKPETKVANEPKKPEHMENMHNQHDHKSADNAMKSDPMTPVFDSYFMLKDALVKSDGVAAAKESAALLAALNNVQMKQLSMESHTVWMKVMDELKFDAEHIAETKDVPHQRDHFISLSDNMYAMMKVNATKTPVYYQHCPMANEGKGANWLSKESTVKNPYYGSKMLSCGKTVETIKK